MIPGAWLIWTPGDSWQDLCRRPLNIAKSVSSEPYGFKEEGFEGSLAV